ncbi:hypothetical protein FJ692_30085 [Pseudomonas fluorescens]|nr:hypothetical protein FJ692_30085 [Pseudomonas fluorescens]
MSGQLPLPSRSSMRQSNAGERCDTECNKIITIAQTATVRAMGSSVGAGLPAMQTPRYARPTVVMLSQASQLPHFDRVV